MLPPGNSTGLGTYVQTQLWKSVTFKAQRGQCLPGRSNVAGPGMKGKSQVLDNLLRTAVRTQFSVFCPNSCKKLQQFFL